MGILSVDKPKIQALGGNGPADDATFLAEIAAWCSENNSQFDNYGHGSFIESFEAKVANLLGFGAARFMPSGVLAQLVALKIWCDQSSCNHFEMHPTSHLELHEERAYAHLYQLRATLVGPQDSPLLAKHIRGREENLAALLVELPIRESGGQLPSWHELEELKAEAKHQGMRLHLDGARLWEAGPFYDRDYKDICRGFDSVYVSFYKGIGALPGAMLLGSEDFIDQSKLWQRRAGGTIQTLGPQVASAAMLLDKRLACMPDYWRRAKQLAVMFQDILNVRCVPSVPQANMMHIYLPFSADSANAARDQVIEEQGIKLFGRAMVAGVKESYFELSVGDKLLGTTDQQVAELFERFMSIGNQKALAHG